MKYKWLFLLVAVLWLSGCATRAEDSFVKVRLGMDQPQVRETLGEPNKVSKVAFPGITREYELWEYEMIPQMPGCVSEGVGRVLTGIVTLGLSEVAWSHAKTSPHWIYFLDGKTVFTSPSIICRQDLCRLLYHRDEPMPTK